MKIAINALSATLGAGVTFYRNVLPELAAVDSENEYVVLLHKNQAKLFPAIPERFEVRYISGASNFLSRSLWEQIVLPFLLKRWNVDILYSQGNFTSLFAPCAKVFVITGSVPYSAARLEPFPSRLKARLIGLASLVSARTATRVVFLSKDSQDKIRRKLMLEENKTPVVYYEWTPLD